jgi:alpha-amylase
MNLLNSSEITRNVIFYFQVHQPKRLRPMRFFDIGTDVSSFNDSLNRDIIQRVSKSCYLPANALLLKLIRKHPGVRVAFSISGIALDQFSEYAPEVIDSFRELADTGAVEFLGETYYHSLACLMSGHEFEIQVLKHAELVEKHFGKRPEVFRNSELIYNDQVGKRVSALGFKGVFTDGVQRVLHNDKSANQLYQHPDESSLRIFLRNYVLSDDIAFRFSQPGNPLTAETYLSWLSDIPSFEKVVNIALDYETFGEHHKKATGIFAFLKALLTGLAKSKTDRMLTPSEAIQEIHPFSSLSVPEYVSWADRERDLSAWLGNDMQKDAFASLTKLEKTIKALGNPEILKRWRMLQTSDHFYYMSTKRGSDGTVHNYFSPFPSPYEAFINYMNVLTDFTIRMNNRKSAKVITRKPVLKSTPREEVSVYQV